MARSRLEDDETDELFPELDLHDPKHKAIFAAARKYHRELADRKALLGESKKKCDSHKEKLLKLLHEAKLTKFRFRGIKLEVFQGEESVQVELDDDVDGDGEE